jgi:predicted  nucleic acid-binding Zn-ribbon protein
MILQKERLEVEVADLANVIQFWHSKNAEFEESLTSLSEKLGNVPKQKKSQTLRLLEDLRALSSALDEAIYFLQNYEQLNGV